MRLNANLHPWDPPFWRGSLLKDFGLSSFGVCLLHQPLYSSPCGSFFQFSRTIRPTHHILIAYFPSFYVVYSPLFAFIIFPEKNPSLMFRIRCSSFPPFAAIYLNISLILLYWWYYKRASHFPRWTQNLFKNQDHVSLPNKALAPDYNKCVCLLVCSASFLFIRWRFILKLLLPIFFSGNRPGFVGPHGSNRLCAYVPLHAQQPGCWPLLCSCHFVRDFVILPS